MPDREKLLKGLKCCIKSDRGCFCPDDCPYDDNDEDYCETLIKLDALSLLKEQDERIKLLEHQLETITKWRMNAGAFD